MANSHPGARKYYIVVLRAPQAKKAETGKHPQSFLNKVV